MRTNLIVGLLFIFQALETGTTKPWNETTPHTFLSTTPTLKQHLHRDKGTAKPAIKILQKQQDQTLMFNLTSELDRTTRGASTTMNPTNLMLLLVFCAGMCFIFASLTVIHLSRYKK